MIELHEIENLSNLIKKNHLKNQFKNTLLSFFLLNNKYDSLDKQQQYEILIKLRETENLSNDLIKKNHLKNTFSFALNNKRDSLREYQYEFAIELRESENLSGYKRWFVIKRS